MALASGAQALGLCRPCRSIIVERKLVSGERKLKGKGTCVERGSGYHSGRGEARGGPPNGECRSACWRPSTPGARPPRTGHMNHRGASIPKGGHMQVIESLAVSGKKEKEERRAMGIRTT